MQEKLYIGTNYHPHDWEKSRWPIDIQLMKEAGFQVVRLGHLCWDSFEPEDGIYRFDWFDEVMQQFADAGIQVFLDVSMRPAPLWVHEKCPGCDICSKSGIRQNPVRRYMEDVSDPDYQNYALRFASVLTERYKNHPALMAFGLCNEQGAGFTSYSEGARERFIHWLKEKYNNDIAKLNEAWATQRWSRRLHSFEEVFLPQNEYEKGSPESYLDMKRFYGDGVLDFMLALKRLINKTAPGVLTSSNHSAEYSGLGFDYLKGCRELVDYPGIGFYPGLQIDRKQSLMELLLSYQQRLAELSRPMWCLEFQTGSFGFYGGPAGAMRMHTFFCLIYRMQMNLAWTWRSMLGGEEQYLFGLLDHDGIPGRKYEEYKQIGNDFRILEQYGFPYMPEPEIALAYLSENTHIFQYCPDFYVTPYDRLVSHTVEMLFDRNRDFNVVDLRNMTGNYKLLMIPSYAIMEESSADTVRNFVAEGGTVIMTGYSAMVDEHNQVFASTHPGRLADVFGIRVREFARTSVHIPECFLNDPEQQKVQEKKILYVENETGCTPVEIDYYEQISLEGADVFAVYKDSGECAVSVNHYGKGSAYYITAEADKNLCGWVFDQLWQELGFEKSLTTPEGIAARRIKDGVYFYVNTTLNDCYVTPAENGFGVLGNREITGAFLLKGLDGELIKSCSSHLN